MKTYIHTYKILIYSHTQVSEILNQVRNKGCTYSSLTPKTDFNRCVHYTFLIRKGNRYLVSINLEILIPLFKEKNTCFFFFSFVKAGYFSNSLIGYRFVKTEIDLNGENLVKKQLNEFIFSL